MITWLTFYLLSVCGVYVEADEIRSLRPCTHACAKRFFMNFMIVILFGVFWSKTLSMWQQFVIWAAGIIANFLNPFSADHWKNENYLLILVKNGCPRTKYHAVEVSSRCTLKFIEIGTVAKTLHWRYVCAFDILCQSFKLQNE